MLTDLNLYALQDALNATKDGTIRQVHPAAAAALRRSIKAGALEQTDERVGRGYAWRLSASGRATLHAFNVRMSTAHNYLMRDKALLNIANGY